LKPFSPATRTPYPGPSMLIGGPYLGPVGNCFRVSRAWMAFSMRSWTNAKAANSKAAKPAQVMARLVLGLVWTLLALNAQAKPATLQLETTHIEQRDLNVSLDGQFNLALSTAMSDALHSGVALVFVIRLQVLRTRSLWPDTVIGRTTMRRQIDYHSLSESYQLSVFGAQDGRHFTALRALMAALGRVSGTRIVLHQPWVEGDRVRMAVELDRGSLPGALRLPAHFARDWQLPDQWLPWTAN